MSVLDHLDTIEATLRGDGAVPGGTEALIGAIDATVLPRRLTFRAADGARVSLVVRSRRALRVAEVHPATLWTGEAAPEESGCDPDDAATVAALIGALRGVAGAGTATVESHLIADDLPPAGEPGLTGAQIAEALEARPASRAVDALRDAFPDAADAELPGKPPLRRLAVVSNEGGTRAEGTVWDGTSGATARATELDEVNRLAAHLFAPTPEEPR